jgi:hypothetical protein
MEEGGPSSKVRSSVEEPADGLTFAQRVEDLLRGIDEVECLLRGSDGANDELPARLAEASINIKRITSTVQVGESFDFYNS